MLPASCDEQKTKLLACVAGGVVTACELNKFFVKETTSEGRSLEENGKRDFRGQNFISRGPTRKIYFARAFNTASYAGYKLHDYYFRVTSVAHGTG